MSTLPLFRSILKAGRTSTHLPPSRKHWKENPKSPALYLTLAQLEVSAAQDMKQQRARIEESLAQKRDYAQAIFFFS